MGMRYQVFFDENDYIESFQHTGTELDIYEFDPDTLELEYLNAYKIISNEFILDENRKLEIIAEREQEISKPSLIDVIDAQATYTAIVTDTLIEVTPPNQ